MVHHAGFMWIKDVPGVGPSTNERSGVNVTARMTKSGEKVLQVVAVCNGDWSLKDRLIKSGDRRLMTDGMFESVWDMLRKADMALREKTLVQN